jgi:hypothetical protein
MKFQLTAAREWRVIEGGESRILTTEVTNDFAAQNSSLKQELDRAMMEAKGEDNILEELGAELEELRRMRLREVPNAGQSQEMKTDAESVEEQWKEASRGGRAQSCGQVRRVWKGK